MAKKLTETINPITASGGNLLSPTDWIQRVGWVVMIGAVFAVGSKVLSAADKYIPGNITPTQMQNATASSFVADGTVVY